MKKRLIAYHLPQFHEIKENNEWWGEGYTEWTALNNWRPAFNEHTLRKPGELGYYDLSDPNILEKQYEMASQYGIEGFCFWTYWFGAGERLLERPLEHLLLPKSKIKYCLAWANHTWYDKSNWRLLKEQKYLGKEDYVRFFETMLPHFKNPNYIRKDNKIVFTVFMPQDVPDFDIFANTWNELIKKEGFDGFYFIGDQINKKLKFSNHFDAFMHSPAIFTTRSVLQKIIDRLVRIHSWTFFGPIKYSYPKRVRGMYKKFYQADNFIPSIFSGWDSTARHGKRGIVLEDFNEQTFRDHVDEIFALNTKNEFIFIKSWNEWAEGNLLEPDDILGDSLLHIIKNANSSS